MYYNQPTYIILLYYILCEILQIFLPIFTRQEIKSGKVLDHLSLFFSTAAEAEAEGS